MEETELTQDEGNALPGDERDAGCGREQGIQRAR